MFTLVYYYVFADKITKVDPPDRNGGAQDWETT